MQAKISREPPWPQNSSFFRKNVVLYEIAGASTIQMAAKCYRLLKLIIQYDTWTVKWHFQNPRMKNWQKWAKNAEFNLKFRLNHQKSKFKARQMIPLNLQWPWVAKDTSNRHGDIILSMFYGHDDPSGWKICQILAKIAEKLAETLKSHLK